MKGEIWDEVMTPYMESIRQDILKDDKYGGFDIRYPDGSWMSVEQIIRHTENIMTNHILKIVIDKIDKI